MDGWISGLADGLADGRMDEWADGKRKEESCERATLLKAFEDPDNNIVVVLREDIVFGKAVKVLDGKEDVGGAEEELEEEPKVRAVERGKGIGVIKASSSREGREGRRLEKV